VLPTQNLKSKQASKYAQIELVKFKVLIKIIFS